MTWLNADDLLVPWTFTTVLEIGIEFKDIEWISGIVTTLNESGAYINSKYNYVPVNSRSVGGSLTARKSPTY